jgi:hypothetical protein
MDLTPVEISDLTSGGTMPAGAQVPANGLDGTTRRYAFPDTTAYSTFKTSVSACTTAALPACTYANGASGVGATLTANANGAFPTIDFSETLSQGERILVNNQVAALQNGIYVLTNAGSGGTPWVLTRATDLNQTSQFSGLVSVYVTAGTSYGGSTMNFVGTPTVGTQPILFWPYQAAPNFVPYFAATGNVTVSQIMAGTLIVTTNATQLTLDPSQLSGNCTFRIQSGGATADAPMTISVLGGAYTENAPAFIYEGEIWEVQYIDDPTEPNQGFWFSPVEQIQGYDLLQPVNSINAATAGPVALIAPGSETYENPGLQFYITRINIVCLTANTVSVVPNISVGTNGGINNIANSQACTGLNAAGLKFSLTLQNPLPAFPSNDGATTLSLAITVPATAVAMTIRPDLEGYWAP